MNYFAKNKNYFTMSCLSNNHGLLQHVPQSNPVRQLPGRVSPNTLHRFVQSAKLADYMPQVHCGMHWAMGVLYFSAGCAGTQLMAAQAYRCWQIPYRSLIIENPEMLHFCSWFFRACPGTSFQEISFMEFSVCIFRCCFCPQSLQHMQTAHL